MTRNPSPPIAPRIPRTARRLAAVAVGWLLCECLVRILVPGPIFYSTWFTPGAHERDSELGFVFTPSFDGAMRHPDGVWMEPIKLNQRGMRQTEDSGVSDRRVVMLGGASMAFSFGLSDEESLHTQTSTLLNEDAQVEVVSWPGFTIEQDLRKLARFEEDMGLNEAIVFAYSEADYQLAESLPAVGRPLSLHMRKGVVLPNDPAAQLLGGLYYKSVVVAGAARWIQAAREILGVAPSREESRDVAGERNASPEGERRDGVPLPNNQQPVAILAAEQLRRRGIEQVLVVALPHQLRFIGPDSLEAYQADDIKILDLRRLSQQMEMDWIAGGHYGPKSSREIASRIARALKSVPNSRLPRPERN